MPLTAVVNRSIIRGSDKSHSDVSETLSLAEAHVGCRPIHWHCLRSAGRRGRYLIKRIDQCELETTLSTTR